MTNAKKERKRWNQKLWFLVHWLVEELWGAKGKQIQSVSNPLHKAGLYRQ